MSIPRWIASFTIAVTFAPHLLILAQEARITPSATAPASADSGQPAAAAPAKPGKKYSHANDFLIRGTVFTESGLSFPGVQLRIRRTSEKKFRWESYTNSRGDFAIRVPQGSEYEVVVHEKHFVDQKRTLDAKSGEREQPIVFRMEPEAGSKK